MQPVHPSHPPGIFHCEIGALKSSRMKSSQQELWYGSLYTSKTQGLLFSSRLTKKPGGILCVLKYRQTSYTSCDSQGPSQALLLSAVR